MVPVAQVLPMHAHRLSAFLSFAAAAAGSLAIATTAVAQCGPAFQARSTLPDADARVMASCLWDRDGSGPLPPVLAIGGAFTRLGNSTSRGITLFDPATGDCATLGTGLGPLGYPLTAQVLSFVVAPNNDLIVGGVFLNVGGVAADSVLRWNGTSWLPMAGGTGYAVRALAVLPGGDVVAGGSSNGLVPGVRRWNGTVWSPVGSGLVGMVEALAVLPNGDLVAGGTDLLTGGVALARWDGVAWSAFAGGVSGSGGSGAVTALKVLTSGDLVVAGAFATAGGMPANNIARWDGTAWSSLGSGTDGHVYALSQLASGDLVAGGSFTTAGGIAANQVGRWNGVSWTGLASGLGVAPTSNERAVRTLTEMPNGDLVSGGGFDSSGGDADCIARWDGTAWRQLRPGTGGMVRASALAANGDLLVVGDFTTFEGIAARRVARLSGGVWQPLGSGADGPVHAVTVLANGDVVIGGDFASVGGVAARRVAQWDGSNWKALGAGLPAIVRSLAPSHGGQILASGDFLDAIAVWDGQSWNGTGIASPYPTSIDRELLALPGGDVLSTVGGQVARWDGSAWQLMPGYGVGGPVAWFANGDVAVGAGQWVRLWTGAGWTQLGSTPFSWPGTVTSLLALPDGDLLAGGTFTAMGSTALARLARWDTSAVAWVPVGSGADGTVNDLRWRPDGGVLVAGAFANLGGVATGGLSELRTTCPATAVTVGTGCVGSGGANALAVTTWPWIGGALTSRATGMPANGIAVEVLGFGQFLQPLASVLPQAGAACMLATTPDLLRLHLPTAPALDVALALPDSVGLVGASFRQQIVPLEFAAGGVLQLATSTNALQVTIGAF